MIGLRSHSIPDSPFSALSTLSHCCPFSLLETLARPGTSATTLLLTCDRGGSDMGALKMGVIQLGFVLDLYGHDPVGNDRLKADHRGVFIQWVHEEACRGRAGIMGGSSGTPHIPPLGGKPSL